MSNVYSNFRIDVVSEAKSRRRQHWPDGEKPKIVNESLGDGIGQAVLEQLPHGLCRACAARGFRR